MCGKLSYLVLFTILFGVVEAQAAELQWIRAAYCDTRYPAAWSGVGTATRDALVAAGYTALNADELKTWMTARIADKKLSVVVFCQDVVPDTVVETQSAGCTLRKYLDAGGKIVWYSDIPFYYWGHATGVSDTWGDGGAPAVLGFNTSSAPRDTGSTSTFTQAGINWGLTQPWTTQRALVPSVTTNVTVLATDGNGNACAWAKHYVTNDKFRGFVRFRDTAGQAAVEDIIRLAEYTYLKASNPRPADGEIGVGSPLVQWDTTTFALWHDVYFGTTPELGQADYKGRQQLPTLMYWHFAGLEPGQTYYWRIDEVEADGTMRTGDVWKFTAAPTTAFSPKPRNGDKWIDPNVDLSWLPGQGAFKHNLYFGTDRAKVDARDASVHKGTLFVVTYDPRTLASTTTYYWVVDEVGAVNYPGQVWSFTTVGGPSGGVKGEYFANTNKDMGTVPALTRIDPSVDFSWGTDGPGGSVGTEHFSARWTADLEIAAADAYTFITTSDDGVRLWLNDQSIINAWTDQGTTDWFSQPQNLEPGIYSLRMEYYEWEGGAVAQLSWQTPTRSRQIIPGGPLQPPVRARVIYPRDTDVNIPQDATLTWSIGEKAVTHDVYLGTDKAAVEAATFADTAIYKGSQGRDESTFTPGDLEWNKTYYWRVDEVNDTAVGSPWKGSVWSFTTANFLVVDDFESYTNDSPNRIFQAWIDGWGFSPDDFFPTGDPGNGTGAAIGNDIWAEGTQYTTIAETTIVRPGGSRQSMPFDYNNIYNPFYSETVRTWTSPQNWKTNGVTDLLIHFRGSPVKFAQTATGFTMSAAGADIVNGTDEFRFAYKKLTGDGSIAVKVDAVQTASNWTKAGVMVRESLDPLAMQVHMISAARQSLVEWMYRGVTNGTTTTQFNTPAGSTPVPVWVRITRVANVFTGEYSTNGTTWTKITQTGGTASSITLNMPASLYVGFVVCSQAVGVSAVAQFSDVKTTGNVTGQWQTADIGITHPGNDPDTLYVVVQDSAGKLAVVANPDPGAVNASQWTAWKIPLSEFTNVNLGAVKKMYIGVGDRQSPEPDGSGKLYIDDIRVVKP